MRRHYCRHCKSILDFIFSLQPFHSSEQGVIIGYDHRKLGNLSSLGFAHLSAAVLLSQGYKVFLLEEFVPTPFVAFGVSHLKCAGITKVH